MNTKRLFSIIFIIFLTIPFFSHETKAGNDVEPFIGRWALQLPNGPGWLEIRQEEGYLDADILWMWGSVVPVDNIYMKEGQLIITRNREVVRQKDEAGKPLRSHTITTTLQMEVNKDKLTGQVITPSMNGDGVRIEEFTGTRIPEIPEPPDLSKIKYGEPVELFNEKDLSGWKLTNPNAKSAWVVEDGILKNLPEQKEGVHVFYGNLRTEQEFRDFNLKIDVNVPKGSNSGIYLRGLYEVQILDSYELPLDSHHMGAVYSRITPSVKAEKPADEWQSFDITLYDRHVTIILNGVKIIDNEPLLGITGGALTSDQFAPGPIYLQGDHGKVMFRNIVLTPIKN